MPSTTLTSKGQMTLPKVVRDRLQLKEGDRLDTAVENGIITLTPATVHIEDIFGLLPRPKRSRSIEEMNAAVAKRACRR